jgi:ssDNA-binding Zn-finger/Zn-ribbon topoisomerase 1
MATPKFMDNMETDIVCPECEEESFMLVKTNRKNGHQFLGCANYPQCTYARGIPEEWIMRANGQPDLFTPVPDEPMRDDEYQSFVDEPFGVDWSKVNPVIQPDELRISNSNFDDNRHNPFHDDPRYY